MKKQALWVWTDEQTISYILLVNNRYRFEIHDRWKNQWGDLADGPVRLTGYAATLAAAKQEVLQSVSAGYGRV